MKIELSCTWRPGGRIWWPGVYRVPEDMPRELAEQALKERVAWTVGEPKKQPAAAAAPVPPETKPRRSPRNRAKRPPETKAE